MTPGYPKLRPTFALWNVNTALEWLQGLVAYYAEMASKNIAKTEIPCSLSTSALELNVQDDLTGSEESMILFDSATQIQNIPRKMYHRSKLSWFRTWDRT